MLDVCDMIDLEFFGSRFTWLGKINNILVSKRLDRGVGGYAWRMKFPEATVEHLVKRRSDHNPLLLRCHHIDHTHQDRPFRFQAEWCTHSGYSDVVQKAWGNASDIVTSLQKVSIDSITFNKEVLGNIFMRKRKLENRLRGIQKELERVDSAQLLILQKNLLNDYENILFQEETMWYQKSRENWIKLGSRNTSFFHAQTVIRRKRNKIHGLNLPSGSWCTDPDTLKAEALKAFFVMMIAIAKFLMEGLWVV